MQTRWNLRVWLTACLAGAMFAGGESLALAQQDDAAQQRQDQQQQDEQQQSEQERQAAEESQSGGSTKMGQFEGLVDDELRITINDQTQRFRTNEQTQVTINGQRSQLDELDAGDDIRIQVGEDGIVQSVTATRRPGTQGDERRGQQQAQRGQAQQGQPQRQGQAQQRQGQPPRGQQQAQGQRGRQGRSPVTLGVRLGPSPTTGVLIRDLQPQGPAERAGLQTGDYIIRIDDQKIDDLQAFDQAMSQAQPGDSLQMTVWRDNQEEQLTLNLPEQNQVEFRPEGGPQQGQRPRQLAQGQQDRGQFDGQDRGRFQGQDRRQTQGRGQFQGQNRRQFQGQQGQGQRGQQGQQGWLGVLLDDSDTDVQGVRIVNVYPSGPAARAGLRQGDIIIEVNNQDVQSAQDAVEVISSSQPNEQLDMVIVRNDQTESLNVMLADRRDFFGPTSQFGGDMEEQRGFRDDSSMIPEHAMMLEQHRRFAEQHQRIEQRLEQVLQELEELRRQLGQGGPQQPGPQLQQERPQLQQEQPEAAQESPQGRQPGAPEQPEPGNE